jgi:hypothetical protein
MCLKCCLRAGGHIDALSAAHFHALLAPLDDDNGGNATSHQGTSN